MDAYHFEKMFCNFTTNHIYMRLKKKKKVQIQRQLQTIQMAISVWLNIIFTSKILKT